jgi:hypothetical protein
VVITVHSEGKWIVLTRKNAPALKHEVPKKNKFFMEELRLYREEIFLWICGGLCEELIVYMPSYMSFYRRALYNAIVKATGRRDKLVLIITLREETATIR